VPTITKELNQALANAKKTEKALKSVKKEYFFDSMNVCFIGVSIEKYMRYRNIPLTVKP
jgi:hypothetical protein